MCFSVMRRSRDPATTYICMHSAPAACLEVPAPFFPRFPPPATVRFLKTSANNSSLPTSSSRFQGSGLDCLQDMHSPGRNENRREVGEESVAEPREKDHVVTKQEKRRCFWLKLLNESNRNQSASETGGWPGQMGDKGAVPDADSQRFIQHNLQQPL